METRLMAKGMVNNQVILILVFFLSSGCGLLAPLFGPVYQTSTSNVDQAKDQGYIRFTDVTEEHLIYVDGTSIGTGAKFTPDALLAVPPGSHTVEIVHGNLTVLMQKVFISTGSTRTVALQ